MSISHVVSISWLTKVSVEDQQYSHHSLKAGYQSTPYTIRPFDEVEIGQANPHDKQRMRAFNQQIASIHICVEHAFGKLKGRFLSLKDLGRHRDINDAYKAIEAMMVVHNLGIDWEDHPELIDGFNPWDDWDKQDLEDAVVDPQYLPPAFGVEANIPEHETEAWLRRKGREIRWALLEALFPL